MEGRRGGGGGGGGGGAGGGMGNFISELLIISISFLSKQVLFERC